MYLLYLFMYQSLYLKIYTFFSNVLVLLEPHRFELFRKIRSFRPLVLIDKHLARLK
jgi:hypothetical protein